MRDPEFPVALRGYDRAAVDRYVAKVAKVVEQLEARQLKESVVQEALDEVGEQTSGILQHAHETAEEIAAQARAQAEGRIQHAERDAEGIRREAEEFAERTDAETRALREERLRLIDELRRLADEVLGVADDAYERLPDLSEDETLEAPASPTGDGTAPGDGTGEEP